MNRLSHSFTRWPSDPHERSELATLDIDFVIAIRRINREGDVSGPLDWQARMGLHRVYRAAVNTLNKLRREEA